MLLEFPEISVHIKAIAAITGGIAAFLVAVGVIWAKGIKPALKGCSRVSKMMESVDRIVAEVLPNGGGSIRDSIDRIEKQLTHVAGTQSAINQDAEVGLFMCDLEGRNIEVNRTYCKMVGASKEQLLGLGWRTYIDTSTRTDYDDEWRDAFQAGRELDLELTFLNPSTKNKVDVLVKTYPVKNAAAEVVEYVGIMEILRK